MLLEHNQAELINYLEHNQHDVPGVLVQSLLIKAVTEILISTALNPSYNKMSDALFAAKIGPMNYDYY